MIDPESVLKARLRWVHTYQQTQNQALNAAHFVREHLVKEFPFPVRRIQSDEFIGIEFRLNRPRAPHLNGKVERYQRTDRTGRATIDIKAPREQLEEQLALWQSFSNGERTHSSLHNKTPKQRFQEVKDLVPPPQQIKDAYTPPRWNINNSYSV